MGESAACRDDERISLLMSLELDGLLDSGDRQRLHEHLAVCRACRAEWAAMHQVSELFKEAPVAGPRPGFAGRVEYRLSTQARQRRRAFRGAAVVTGSLSLATLTVATAIVIILGLVAWNWLDSLPSIAQGTNMVGQLASGMGLVGRGLSLFLSDLLLAYGLPLMLVVGICLMLLAGMWIWLFVKRPDGYRRNGFAGPG